MSKVSKNIISHEPLICRKDREILNKHKSAIIWFTGFSGSGKSSLANTLEDYLYKNKIRTYILDGDNIRNGLCIDLGFSDQDRTENIRRIGEVSKIMMNSGVIVLTAFISPFIKDREVARRLVGEGEFIEVFCDAPLEVCESRDVKGLYKKARKGEIPEFTGISSPYEKPEHPELCLQTGVMSINECLDQLVYYLKEKEII